MRWIFLLSVLLLAACNMRDIETVDLRLTAPSTIERVEQAILDAADLAGWEVKRTEPGSMALTKREGRRAARIRMDYSERGYDAVYLSSVNLYDRGGGRIHRRYYIWVYELVQQIDDVLDPA